MTDFPLESIGNLLAGAGKSYLTVDMLPGEKRLYASVANWRNLTGGLLILTDSRLVFSPWNVADIATVLSWAVPKLGGPDFATKLVKSANDAVGGVRVAGEVVAARAGKGRALLHPPTLIAALADGMELEFGILHDKLAMNIAHQNETARDAFVAAINSTR